MRSLRPKVLSLVAAAALPCACWLQVEDPLQTPRDADVPEAPGATGAAEAAGTAPPIGTVVTELDPRVWSLLQTRDGDLWFGTNGAGVYRYDGEQLVHYDRDDGLVGAQVRDLAQHGSGDVLIATNSGVTRFDGRQLVQVEVTEAAPGEGWELDPSDTWLTYEPGLRGPSRYDGETLVSLELTGSAHAGLHAKTIDPAGFPTTGIYSVHVDRRGHLWFGTAAAGLCRFDGEHLDWLYEEQLTTTPSGGAFGIRSIHEEAASSFWLGNTRQRYQVEREAAVSDGRRLLVTKKIAGLPGPMDGPNSNLAYIASMVEGADGDLWMAVGSRGVWHVRDDVVTKHVLADGAYVAAVLLDDAGRVWAGTIEDGVYLLEGEAFERFAPL